MSTHGQETAEYARLKRSALQHGQKEIQDQRAVRAFDVPQTSALDEKKLAALRARRAKGRARIAQLVRQSFQRHDLDHNGYLDHHESAEFFLHYVDLVRARARRMLCARLAG